jgi:hypothetical protein
MWSGPHGFTVILISNGWGEAFILHTQVGCYGLAWFFSRRLVDGTFNLDIATVLLPSDLGSTV